MSKRSWLLAAIAAACVAGTVVAQQFPILDMVANRDVQKYQSSTCEQRWESKGKHGPEEQRLVALLRNDPAMRQAFFDKISGPVVNKMFECGMVP